MGAQRKEREGSKRHQREVNGYVGEEGERRRTRSNIGRQGGELILGEEAMTIEGCNSSQPCGRRG